MIAVNVNTSLYKEKLKIVLRDSDYIRDIYPMVALKIGDNCFLSVKSYIIVPVVPKEQSKQVPFSLAKYGGQTNHFTDLMFNNQ
jgi:hypothetical protein